ncbi:MAG TPA: alkaline phosphatase family protein [Streptosporangiaceae bacterium]|nr:alkaline phosphatase family protein [Streptosporangiaceae bacterium]
MGTPMRFVHGHKARAAVTAAALLAALALPAAVHTTTAGAVTAGPAVASAPVARAASAGRVPHYNHIAVIMFADHGYSAIAHNKYAPTFNRLAGQYGLATRYYTTADPDTANIMSLLAGNSFGVNDGSPYWDQQVNKPSLLSQLDAAHKSWKEYVQSIPYPGYLGDCYPTFCQETDTLYNQAKFNAVPDLTSVAANPAEARKLVPASGLAADARDGRLPDFSFIDPDECANMHGGPPWCQDSPDRLGQPNDNKLVSGGDSYLRQVTHEIMTGPQWRRGNNAIVVTWTEGTTSAGCCDANPGTGRVFTVVVTSHGPRHLTDATPFNHYSLLSTIQHAFGLGCLQNTCDTRHVVPMARLFGAPSDRPERFPAARPAARSAGRAPARPAAARPGSAASSWHQVASPNTSTNDNDLWSIAGHSPSDLWAVGSLLPDPSATIVQTLALHYNGQRWSRVPTPDSGPEANSLYGVAALPDGTAWATGIYTQASGHSGRALTMHWNGHEWAIVPAANPGSSDDMLYSVAAVSDSDVWAVGTYSGPDGFFHPLIEHWNGLRWTVCRAPGVNAADGILTSVTSADGQGVWATGQLSGDGSDRQVVLHLAGSSWATAPSPSVRTPGGPAADAYPASISISAQGPWLAGNDRAGDSGFSTLVEAPAGEAGLRELGSPNPTPQDNYLQGIAPVHGGQDAWAVGDSVPVATGNAASLIEYGSAAGGWTTIPSPDPGAANGNTILDGVLALSSSNVWAVGTYDGSGGMRTLILHYTR